MYERDTEHVGNEERDEGERIWKGAKRVKEKGKLENYKKYSKKNFEIT